MESDTRAATARVSSEHAAITGPRLFDLQIGYDKIERRVELSATLTGRCLSGRGLPERSSRDAGHRKAWREGFAQLGAAAAGGEERWPRFEFLHPARRQIGASDC
jgi:hypothetical protein